MTVDKPSGRKPASEKSPRGASRAMQNPEWTSGLRQLYDSVVDEPLPDAFKDLLSKLDAKD